MDSDFEKNATVFLPKSYAQGGTLELHPKVLPEIVRHNSKKRRCPLSVRFRPEELTLLKTRAEAARLKLRGFIKQTVLNSPSKPLFSKEDFEELRSLRFAVSKIGVNINQIAKRRNSAELDSQTAFQTEQFWMKSLLSLLQKIDELLANGSRHDY